MKMIMKCLVLFGQYHSSIAMSWRQQYDHDFKEIALFKRYYVVFKVSRMQMTATVDLERLTIYFHCQNYVRFIPNP